jgi:hypothetical protein
MVYYSMASNGDHGGQTLGLSACEVGTCDVSSLGGLVMCAFVVSLIGDGT